MGTLEEDKERPPSKRYKAYKQLVEKVSYFVEVRFWHALSNHYAFKQRRVLSPLTALGFFAFGEMFEMVRNEGDNYLPTNLI